MKVYQTADIRNVALIGHGGAGKTSLASALLFAAGATKRLGSVVDGTATTDFDEEETDRKISLQTSVAHAEWKNTKINLIDTPGYASFVADAKAAVAAADACLVVIEALAGVQVMTERVVDYAAHYGIPLMFVVNKLDRENSSFDAALASIQGRFGRQAVPVEIPIGSDHSFDGVVDLIAGKAYRFATDGSGKRTMEPIPADLADAAAEMRSSLVEMVAENDDTLMEHFFEAGDLSEDELSSGLRKAIAARKIFPVFCSAALTQVGAESLLDSIVRLAPAPGQRGPAQGVDPRDPEQTVTRPVQSDAPLSVFVFKTVADAFAGKLSILRVCSGTLKGDSHVVNTGRDNFAERLGGLSVMQGKQTLAVPELHAGDIGVVAKLKETQTSDTLSDPAQPILYPPVTHRASAISFAVEPLDKGDEEKIHTALVRLMEEDPALQLSRDARTGQQLVSGTGQVHVEVALSKMKRKFGVDAILHPPKVPYFETFKRRVEHVEGKHKKQSGGRGQFGVCVCSFEPLPAGSGIEFVDKIFGGSIPQNYRPAVEKGVRESAEHGWLSGCPMVDFRVTLTDGKYHNVDSSEMAFKIAGSLAFKEAMAKAAPTILEPIWSVEIFAPEESMGDIMGDLSSRRGKPQGMETVGHNQVIRAQVPLSEMLTYSSTLKSLTSDRGSYTMEFDHYEEAPAHIREKIIAEYAKRKEAKAG